MSNASKGLKSLTPSERELVRQCLHATVHGPFFPDREFHTLFGLQRQQVAAVLVQWPDVDDTDEVVQVAINNSMNNLIGYPHRKEREWPDFIAASRREIKSVFSKWRGAPRNHEDVV
jgi:hypothetical protein